MALLETTIKYCTEHSLNMVGVRPYSVYGQWGRPDCDIMRLATGIYSGESVEVYQTRWVWSGWAWLVHVIIELCSVAN